VSVAGGRKPVATDAKDLRVSLEAGNRSCISCLHHIHVARRKPVATGGNAARLLESLLPCRHVFAALGIPLRGIHHITRLASNVSTTPIITGFYEITAE